MQRAVFSAIFTFLVTASAAFANTADCPFLISPHAFVRVTASALKARALLPEDLDAVLASPMPVSPFEPIGERHDNIGYLNAYKLLLGQSESAANWPSIQTELRQLQSIYLGADKVSAAAHAHTRSLPEFRQVGTVPRHALAQVHWLQTHDGRLLYTLEGTLGIVKVFALGQPKPIWTGPVPMNSVGKRDSAYVLSELPSGDIVFHHAVSERFMGVVVVRDYKISRDELPTVRTFRAADSGVLTEYHTTRSGTEFLEFTNGFLGLSTLARRPRLNANPPDIWVGETSSGDPLIMTQQADRRAGYAGVDNYIFWRFDGSQWLQMNEAPSLSGEHDRATPLALADGKIALAIRRDSGVDIILDAIDKPNEKIKLEPIEYIDYLEMFETADGRVLVAGRNGRRKSFEVFEPAANTKSILLSHNWRELREFRWFGEGRRAFLMATEPTKIEYFEPLAGQEPILSLPNDSDRKSFGLISDGNAHAYWISHFDDKRQDQVFSLLGRVTGAKP